MSECKQAQSHEQQIAELKDSRLPKTEREHAAVREIERLEQVLRWVCNRYMVPDHWQGQDRENRIQKAMDYAIREVHQLTRRRQP